MTAYNGLSIPDNVHRSFAPTVRGLVANRVVAEIDDLFSQNIYSSGGVTYVGIAPMGSSDAAAVWAIKRITVSGSLTTIRYADGNALFDNVWNDYASLSYS